MGESCLVDEQYHSRPSMGVLRFAQGLASSTTTLRSASDLDAVYDPANIPQYIGLVQ